MKIDVLRLIEEALIGGRNGEMVYIENNPLIASIFRESKKSFKDFLRDIINESIEDNTPHKIERTITIREKSDEYVAYKQAKEKYSKIEVELKTKLKALARKENSILEDCSYDVEFYEEYYPKKYEELRYKI